MCNNILTPKESPLGLNRARIDGCQENLPLSIRFCAPLSVREPLSSHIIEVELLLRLDKLSLK